MNELLNRLKNSVNKEILNHIDDVLMEQNKFVPISVKDKFLFVAVNSSSDKETVNKILKEYFPYQIKFIQVPDVDLDELIASLKRGSSPQSVEEGHVDKQIKLGELLIQKGYITDVQLLQALAESKRQKMPIGSTLFKLGFISLDQLKSILHLQTGFDMVSNEQLAKQDKFVNILPEDFIKEKSLLSLMF